MNDVRVFGETGKSLQGEGFLKELLKFISTEEVSQIRYFSETDKHAIEDALTLYLKKAPANKNSKSQLKDLSGLSNEEFFYEIKRVGEMVIGKRLASFFQNDPSLLSLQDINEFYRANEIICLDVESVLDEGLRRIEKAKLVAEGKLDVKAGDLLIYQKGPGPVTVGLVTEVGSDGSVVVCKGNKLEPVEPISFIKILEGEEDLKGYLDARLRKI